MLTRMILTNHCSKKNIFFVVQLLMWAVPDISVNYPWYEHANSCRKRWCLAVAANGWHDWAIRILIRCFSFVSGCIAPCFVFLGGKCLCIRTGNHGNTLYCVHIIHGKRSLQLVYKHFNFRTKVHTDFKYVPKGSLKIALYDYQQNSKLINIRLPT